MNSLIYQGEVTHARLIPVKHSFRYPVYFYAFDIDELAELGRRSRLFGYNQLRPVAIHDKDYLHYGEEPLREKLRQVLQEHGINENPARVVLVTAARYFNYIFNPISFFYCYTSEGRLNYVLAQVNNTFKEMHLYLLDMRKGVNDGDILQADQVKQFHVSPFFTREGRYEFKLTQPHHHLDNQIHYYRHDKRALIARIKGRAIPFTPGRLLRTVTRHPLMAILTMPRILWQAARLYWQRRLPVNTRPVPDHPMTIRHVPPAILDRIGRIFVHKHLSHLQRGSLQLTCPEGRSLHYGEESGDVQHLNVHENRFFRRVMLCGEIGFGEAYTDGDWTTDDLPRLLTLLAGNAELINDRKVITAALGRWLNVMRHLRRANTIKGSSRNIREHYDLSNEFFATFLDPSMTYSAALFQDENESLEQAQRNKLRTIIEKAAIRSSDHVLEIGCGWGSFAIEAVQQTGCRVTGITLSHEQLALARERVEEAGLEDRIELKICDYRHIEGQFDKIVSIEMLEAVGHVGLKSFFRACDRALSPGGRAVVQVITIPDRKYEDYRTSADWIRKHIFPGGHLPSLGAIAKAMGVSSLTMSRLENYGLDYARTLDLWRQTLLHKRERIFELGYDEVFLRKWEYYFAYCQAGFTNRIIDLAQLEIDKPTSALKV
jgi:cyclopropane-fatty-acyl-phospholipid synthase